MAARSAYHAQTTCHRVASQQKREKRTISLTGNIVDELAIVRICQLENPTILPNSSQNHRDNLRERYNDCGVVRPAKGEAINEKKLKV